MGIELLLRPDAQWLVPLNGSASAAFDAAMALGHAASQRVVARVLRGQKMRTTGALFDEVAAALQFPPYFGENWDALDECVTDLEWLPGDVYMLVITDAVHVLELEGAATRKMFWEKLKMAAKEWGQPSSGTPQRPAKMFRVLPQFTAQQAGHAQDILPAGESGPFFDVGTVR